MKVNTDGVLLAAWAETSGKQRALDIGTGSGIIPLILAQRNAELYCDGVEIDVLTAQQAELNAKISKYKDRIRIQNEALQVLRPKVLYDLIISNPPFFSKGSISPQKGKAIAKHSTTLTFKDITDFCKKYLNHQGNIVMIIPFDRVEELTRLMDSVKFYTHRLCRISSFKESQPFNAMVSFQREKPAQIVSEHLYLYKVKNQYSKEYIELVKDIYIGM